MCLGNVFLYIQAVKSDRVLNKFFCAAYELGMEARSLLHNAVFRQRLVTIKIELQRI